MIRSTTPRTTWTLRLALILSAAIVIPACGRTLTATIVPYSIANATLASGVVGVAYTQTLTTSSATGSVTWSQFAGSLPPGLALNSVTGQITGTPTGSASTWVVIIRAIDGAGNVTQRSFLILLTGGAAGTLAVATASPLPGGDVGTPYDFGFAAFGGTGNYAWSLVASSLPPGLILNPANGGITGVPSAPGTFNFTIQANDGVTTVSQACQLAIASPLQITAATMPPGSVGGAYSRPSPISGGSAPFLYSVASGVLPGGLSLNTATGVLSGTPTTAATSGYTIRETDAAGVSALAGITHVINPAPVVTPVVLPASTQGLAYSQTLAATLGTGAYSWALTGGALPNGLALSAGGVISGTSTAAGTFTFTVTVTDAANGTGSLLLSILINPPVTVTTVTLSDWTVNQAGYTQTVVAIGGTGIHAWSSTGTIPTGMTLNAATGILSGTPTAIGPFTFTAIATDTLGATGSHVFLVTINPLPTIATTSLPDWTVNRPYSQTLLPTAATGTPAYSWSLASGTLPAGLTLSSGGLLSGTPTTPGQFTFTVRLTDVAGATVTKTFTNLTINPSPTVLTTSLPNWTINRPYSQTLQLNAGTGTAPITWTITSGAPPTSLTLSSAGLLSGTPTVTGPFTFTVTATDAAGATAIVTFSAVTINPPPTIATALPNWTINRAYPTIPLLPTAGTGTTPYTYAITGGALPTGLAMSVAGVVSGTPTVANPFTFTVTITDTAGATGTRTYTNLTINPVPTVATTTLPDWTITRAYSQTLLTTAATGTSPFSWAITSGTQPTSLSLSTAGVLSGTPSATGSFTFTVTVTDTAGATATQTYTAEKINPLPTIATASLPNWTTGRPYSQTVLTTPATGTPPFNWTITAGTQPTSLGLSTGGLLSGTPTVANTFSFTVTATDAAGAAVSQAYNNLVINPPPTIATALPNWTVTRPYSQTLLVNGGTGTAPFQWTVTTGAPPSPLALTLGGILSGTPNTVGQTTFTVTVTDTAGATGTRTYTNLTMNPLPTVGTTTVPDWTVNFPYTQTLLTTAATGTAPFTWTITSGVQPTSLLLSTGGVLAGTPSGIGTFTFGVTVTDAAGATANQAYNNEVINPALLVTTPAALPGWTQNFAGYSKSLSASGGTGGRTWSVIGGALPAGMGLNSGGVVSGQPTSGPATYSFTAQVQDSIGATGSLLMSIVINPPLVVTTPLPLAAWTQFQPGYSQTETATGGTGARTWSFTSGSLPVGITLAPTTGVVSGTPTGGPATYTVFVQVTDSVGASALAPVSESMTLNPPLNFTGPNSLAPWTTNQPGYGASTSTNGGTGTITWSNPGGGVPSLLVLNTSTGAITGQPNAAAGTYNFQIKAQDSTGAFTQNGFSITINPVPSITTSSPLPDGALSVFYNAVFSSFGGTGTITWTSTTTPPNPVPGLTLSPGGSLSGTPSAGGPFVFSVTATDTTGASTTVPMSLFILAPLTVTTTDPLPAAVAGSSYSSAPLAASGGKGTYTWSVLPGGAIPGGVGFNPAGAWSGTPLPADNNGVYNFTVRVTDVDSRTADKALSITLTGGTAAAISQSPITLPSATLGAPYDRGITATGGTPGYTWAPSAFSPGGSGLSLQSNGHVTGTPSSTGTFTVSSSVTDALAANNVQTITVTVNGALSITTSNPMPSWTVTPSNPYSQSLSQSGGSAGYTWAIASGGLPPGITLNPNTGALTGGPTSAGTFPFTAQVADNAGAITTKSLQITINSAVSVGNSSTLSQWDVNLPGYSQSLIANNGTGGFTWSLIGGSLPTNLSLSGGIISGTPTVASPSVSFTVKVQDNAGSTAQATLNITINQSPTITTTSVPDGTQNAVYPDQQMGVNFGTPGYTWTISAGSLPGGLTLSSSGLISGTPGASGTFPFTVQATDALGAFATKSLSMNVVTGPTVNSQSVNEGQTVNTGVNITLGFTAAMDQSTFTSGAGGTVTLTPAPAMTTPILFFWTSPTQVTLVFDTQLPVGIFGNDLLNQGTPYTLTVTTGVKSTVGAGGLNLGAQFDLHFTTQTQTPSPTVTITPDPLSPTPANTTVYTLLWSRTMDPTQAQFEIKSNLGFDAKSDISKSPLSWTGITGMAWSNSNKTLTVTLNPGLPGNGIYKLQLNNFQSATGNSYNNNGETVVVTPGPSGTAPIVTGIIPTAGTTAPVDASVFVGFTAPMWPSDLLDPTLVVLSGTGVGSVAVDRQIVEFSGIILTPQSAWLPGKTITLTVKAAVRNSAGVAVGADQAFSFTTGAVDTAAMTIDAPFSSMTSGVTDMSPFSFDASFQFTRSGARIFVNKQTLAPQDVSLVEHAAPNIPIKGFDLDGRHGLEVRTNSGWSGLQFSTQYDLILNPTLQNTQGGVVDTTASGNVVTFTTHASGGSSTTGRPNFSGNGGDSKFQTDPSGVQASLQVDVQSPTGASLVVHAVSSPDPGFAPTLTSSGGNFQYNSSGSELSLATAGDHILTYTATETPVSVHTVQISQKLFAFDTSLFPAPSALTVSANGATPSLSWPAPTAPQQVHGVAVIIQGTGVTKGGYIVLVPLTSTTFTVPVDQALPSGSYAFSLHYFHFIDGNIQGASSEANTAPSSTAITSP